MVYYRKFEIAADFDAQVFTDIVVRDGECVCVELLARDRTGRYESAVFLGSIRYEVLQQVYETKVSVSSCFTLPPTNSTNLCVSLFYIILSGAENTVFCVCELY